jgi:hypothetical protein
MEYGTSGVTVGASNAVSASWVAASGFNLTGAFSGNDSSGDPPNIYLKAGFKQCDSALVELGGKKTCSGTLNTAPSIDLLPSNYLISGARRQGAAGLCATSIRSPSKLRFKSELTSAIATGLSIHHFRRRLLKQGRINPKMNQNAGDVPQCYHGHPF